LIPITKIVGGLAGVALLVVAGFAVWYFALRDDGPAAVSTESALQALEQATATTASGNSGGTPAASARTPVAGSDELDGAWKVDTSLGSFVGYRVKEELANIGGTTAVGRTAGVKGDVTIADGRATAATITADMTKLRSQESARDGQLRNQGIEYAKFPTSEFKLSSTNIPDSVEDGETATVTLNGSLTLHGVTKDISMPAEVTLKDGVLVVVGEVEVQFADYAIQKPNAARVVSMEDKGTIEVQLFFTKAA